MPTVPTDARSRRLPQQGSLLVCATLVAAWGSQPVTAFAQRGDRPPLLRADFRAPVEPTEPVPLPPFPPLPTLPFPKTLEDVRPDSPIPAMKIPASNISQQETVVKIKTTPPTSEELFRLETEEQFRARIMSESENLKNKVQFPPLKTAAVAPLPLDRGWAPMGEMLEPNRHCFGRLYFLPRADERYGKSWGGMQPLVSTGWFYFDTATMPVAWWVSPCSCVNCDDHLDLLAAPYPCR